MRIWRDLPKDKEDLGGELVLTIGNFDGVHLGHQAIFKKLIQRAGQLRAISAVMTFDPHPLKVTQPHKPLPLLTPWEEKVKLLEAIGIQLVICLPFTQEFARQTKEEFVEGVLLGKLKVRELFVGHDFAFGYRREGSIRYLQSVGQSRGFKVNIVEPIEVNGNIVSSSLIRQLLLKGEVAEASSLLGRNYVLQGEVVRGHQVGKKLGFPTANLQCENELIPGPGIYAVKVILGDNRLVGVVNIGTCPTFDRKRLSIEVHILNFQQDIYGERIRLEFYQRIREERRFESPEALARQIEKDIELTERIVQL